MCDVVGHIYVGSIHSEDTWSSSTCRSSELSSFFIVNVGVVLISVFIIVVSIHYHQPIIKMDTIDI